MSDDNIQTRLSFLGIDDETRATLQECLPIIQRVLPEALDGFYAHLSRWPELMKLFGADPARAQAVMAHAREAQGRHWNNLFSGRFDDSYSASVRKIGLTHSRIGLEPRWYIGGYTFTMIRLFAAIAHANGSRFNPATAQDKTARMLRAVSQAVMLDMDLAISIYLDENKRVYDEKLTGLAASFEASVKGVVDAVSASASSMQDSATLMSSAAEETSRQSAAASAATEQASSNIHTVAAATEELTASGQEIGSQMSRATQIAGEAVEEANDANATVDGLAEAAQKIGDVVALIQSIAGQTNLLALNATIEAARAGEAGKGFAVVASEVKSLANQTAKATGEISEQVAAMQAVTGSTVDAIKNISKTIAQIMEISTIIAAAVQEQSAATGEISRNVQQASQGTSEISSNIQGVGQAAVDTGEAAVKVLDEARLLAGQADNLRSEVASFLKTLRTA